MAIHIRMTPPTLPHNDEVVTSTRIQVATDPNFDTIIADETTTIPSEFYNITLPNEIVPNNIVYARGMYSTNKAGAEGWGATVTATATNVIERDVDLTVPETAYPPKVTITRFGSTFELPATSILFKIEHETSIVSDIVSMDVIVEDKDGNTILSFLGITRDFEEFKIVKWLLPDTIYILRVSVTLNTGSKSLFSGTLFTTAKIEDEFKIISLDRSTDTSVVICEIPNNMSNYQLELYNDKEMILSQNGTDPSLVYKFNNNEDITLGRVKALGADGVSTGWRYFYLESDICSLPLPFPVSLACG